MQVKKGDTVMVIAGKDKGAIGKVIAAIPTQDRVIVEGVNLVKKHTKIGQTNRGAKTGGIITQEAAIHVSNVLPWSRSTARTSDPGRLPRRRGRHEGPHRQAHERGTLKMTTQLLKHQRCRASSSATATRSCQRCARSSATPTSCRSPASSRSS